MLKDQLTVAAHITRKTGPWIGFATMALVAAQRPAFEEERLVKKENPHGFSFFVRGYFIAYNEP